MIRTPGETASAVDLKSTSLIRNEGSSPSGSTSSSPSYGVSEEKLDLAFVEKEDLLAEAAEYFAIFFFLSHGLPAFKAHVSSPYDIVFDDSGTLKRVQVKSASNGHFHLSSTRNNSTRSIRIAPNPDNFDYWFLVQKNGNAWLIPSNLVKNTRSITPRRVYPGFQVSGSILSKEQIIEDGKTNGRWGRPIKWVSEAELARLFSLMPIQEMANHLHVSIRSLNRKLMKLGLKERPPRKPQRTKIKWPSDDELKDMVANTPLSTLARTIRVSDKSIAKRCKKLGIQMRGVGYWRKKELGLV